MSALLIGLPVAAGTTEVNELRQELEQMRRDYETRIQALERRLIAAENEAKLAASKSEAAQREVQQVVAEAETPAPAASGSQSSDGNAFNPAISLVLTGSLAAYSNGEPGPLSGFPDAGSEARPEGLSLDESELTLSSNVDDWFYGQATIAMHQDGDDTAFDLEEAYLDTLSLPQGFGLRFGRFYSDIGYLNSFHPHAWDFADSPLAYDAFLGGQYGDDGLRLSWLAPTDLFMEFAVETYRGDRYPGGGNGDWALGSLQTASLRLGGDLGLSSSWQMGFSGLWANPDSRSAGGHGHDHGDHEEEGDTDLVFSGDSRLALLDLVWKWAPGGDFSRRYLQLQGEYFYRDEDGDYLFEDTGDQAFAYRGDQRGFYLQGVYQFRPRWRLGLRYDRLWADNRLRPAPGNLELAEDSGLLSEHDPYRWSAMLDYSHSEFSRLRLQYEYDRRVPKQNQVWMLQYIMSLGAHGAHRY